MNPSPPFPQSHGPWQILATREVYRDPWLNVRRDEVLRPDGQPGTHSVVHIKPGVCVVPLDDEGRVYLTEEFHYGVGRVTIEGVSGGIEPDEDPQAAARRELQEELGITAARWRDLGNCDPFTASVVSPTRLFLAQDLTLGPQSPEGTEVIRRVRLPLDDAVERVLSGDISHAPSALLLLKIDALRRRT